MYIFRVCNSTTYIPSYFGIFYASNNTYNDDDSSLLLLNDLY
jgi:hypothetical protein